MAYTEVRHPYIPPTCPSITEYERGSSSRKAATSAKLGVASLREEFGLNVNDFRECWSDKLIPEELRRVVEGLHTIKRGTSWVPRSISLWAGI